MRDIEKEEKPEEKLEMPRSGEALFLEELGRAAEGEIDPLFEELYRWYAAHPEAGIPAETYRKAAFLRCADGVIGKSAASALYGDTLKNSATRLEKYAACAFAHFMEFGLQIRESFRILTNEAGEPEYHRVQLFTTGDERPGLMNFPFEGLTSGSIPSFLVVS